MTRALLLILACVLGGVDARAAGTPRPGPACDCEAYAAGLTNARRTFARRGTEAAVPVTATAHAVFRARVNETYAAAACLVGCPKAAPAERNAARRLLAATAYKSRDIAAPADEVLRRLTLAERELGRCRQLEPGDPECITWHASIRGRLAEHSWNPMLVTLPRALLADFRAARGDRPPGRDLRDGAATRGEAALLLRTPVLLGGDPAAARALMEAAAAAPRFPCAVANRTLLAATRTATGDPARGLAELRATVAAGLPDCTLQRYENAAAVDEAARCLARIETDPALETTWPDACE